jgi:2,4-dienoyl-CoA reductase-like NADH-dependent reductase (Old Yellow Enzyme family)
MNYKRVAQLKTLDQFHEHARSLGIDLSADEVIDPGLWSQPIDGTPTIGNRFCILPMEGWDGTVTGEPSDLTVRRWENFGRSGAKLIWGGEAVAVRADGRANPNQLWLHEGTLASIERLREQLVEAHRKSFGSTDGLVVGLQLTHSGRYCRPHEKNRLEPWIVYRHPILDRRLNLPEDFPIVGDDELRRLIDDFVQAALFARKIGFDFVDIKHCHGYLGHELLSAVDRPGPFGGSLENRARFLREIIQGIQSREPSLAIGVRLSAFDGVPFRGNAQGVGEPEVEREGYRYAFGGDGTGKSLDLSETRTLVGWMQDWGVRLLCVTAGSPYYVPHIQRPAIFPPSDGYLPPEDPLVGVARQIAATALVKESFPSMTVVGSGYSYLQEWLPAVGQGVLRGQKADAIGLGRMVLSYPELPADVLAGRPIERKRLCRTFSDCTTGPRQGLVSGCYPLDPFYKRRPEAKVIEEIRKRRDPDMK